MKHPRPELRKPEEARIPISEHGAWQTRSVLEIGGGPGPQLPSSVPAFGLQSARGLLEKLEQLLIRNLNGCAK